MNGVIKIFLRVDFLFQTDLTIVLSCVGGVLFLTVAILIAIPAAYVVCDKIKPDPEFADKKKRDKARTNQELEEESK